MNMQPSSVITVVRGRARRCPSRHSASPSVTQRLIDRFLELPEVVQRVTHAAHVVACSGLKFSAPNLTKFQSSSLRLRPVAGVRTIRPLVPIPLTFDK